MSKNTTTQITIKPSELIEVLDHCLVSGLVPFIQAPPGVGKSTIIRQFSDTASRSFFDTRLSYAAPTDVRGFPYLDRSGRLTFVGRGRTIRHHEKRTRSTDPEPG